jgi:hypothetical protein
VKASDLGYEAWRVYNYFKYIKYIEEQTEGRKSADSGADSCPKAPLHGLEFAETCKGLSALERAGLLRIVVFWTRTARLWAESLCWIIESQEMKENFP